VCQHSRPRTLQKVPTRHALSRQELTDWLASKGLTESSRQFYVARYLPDVERGSNPFAGGIKSLPRGGITRVPAERQLEDSLFDFLKEHHFRPRRQVKTRNGIADIVLEHAIIELKHELTPGALDSAVQQLYRYSGRLGALRAVIVCSEAAISNALRNVVELAGISIFTFPEEQERLIETLRRKPRLTVV
jgi:hypothetical protein